MKLFALLPLLVVCSCAPRSVPDVPAPDAVTQLQEETGVPDVPAPDAVAVETPPAPEDFSNVLGWFESSYGAGGNRAKNVERAAALLDGTRIGPGETFSFNGSVGPRTLDRGFFFAPVIQDGEMVDGLGGGVCQVSSTTHAASLMAGLDITMRYPHSRPSSYMPLGLDATVSFPTECGGDPKSTAKGCYAPDLRIKNSSDKPVRVHAVTTVDAKLKWKGTLRIEILGSVAPSSKPAYSYGVQKNDPFEKRVKKVGKPTGYHKRSQKGSDGISVYSTLTVPGVDGGTTARHYASKYPPTDEVWEVSNDWPEEGPAPWEADSDAGVGDGATAPSDAPHD